MAVPFGTDAAEFEARLRDMAHELRRLQLDSFADELADIAQRLVESEPPPLDLEQLA